MEERSPFSVSPLIPFASEEALWEWDLDTDNIYFSDGAKKFLGLGLVPHKMRNFLELVNPANLPDLISARAKVVRGEFRGVAESDYSCNNRQVHEHMFTLARNSAGYATRLMGRLSNPDEAQAALSASRHAGAISKTGVWILHVAEKKIWQDPVCASILGFAENEDFPIRISEALARVHESERDSLERHYKLLIQGGLKEESITDIVRVEHTQGNFTPVLVRASAVERDEGGRAILVSGLIALANPKSVGKEGEGGSPAFPAVESMGVGQWCWEAEDEIVWYCPRYLEILGYPPSDCDVFHHHWHLLVHPDDLPKIERAREAMIKSSKNGDVFECTYRMKDVNGSWVWIFDRGCVTWRDESGRAGRMTGSITNITTAQAERDRLEELVRNDSLTGLRSRAFCNLEAEHIEQNQIRPVSAISLDVTGLKMINDSLGHAAGDELLTKASEILRGALRASDFIARTGGDEFLALLTNCDHGKGEKLLRKIQTAFEAYNALPAHMPVLVSCGLGTAQDMSESLTDAIAKADQDMYARKRAAKAEDHALIRRWIKERTGKDAAADDRVQNT